MRATLSAALAGALALAGGCGTQPIPKSDAHLRSEVPPAASAAATPIPQPVRAVPLPPPPEAKAAELKYSVVVANQSVREVLLAMARETKINFDIHPGIEGTITLNAIDQTLRQILTRISNQVDMRWESAAGTISVMPDTPYLRNYRVDYVNMSRDVNESIGIATQVISGAVGAGTAGLTAGNNSTLVIENRSRHRFWETLERNVKDLLRETDKQFPEGSRTTTTQLQRQAATVGAAPPAATAGERGAQAVSPGSPAILPAVRPEGGGAIEQVSLTFREAASVIVNPETGIVSVRATSRQHAKVSEFIDQVMNSARRQVLIEATIVEVDLSDQYQSGVDWSSLALEGLGYSFSQNFLGGNLAESPFFSLTYSNPNAARGGSISTTVKLLSTFGKTRVLSSPKLMVLNNQTAVLKVVDNRVYFTIKADTVTNQTNTQTTFTTTQNVVPVGFIMNVTPQVSDTSMVTINLRPTVTRIIGFVNDPNPALAAARVTSAIPETQTREMESVLKVGSGQTAILGGLMLDSFEGSRDGLPIASRIPIVGDFFSYRNDTARKSELVIFLRPVIVNDPSIETELATYKRYLPHTEFFKDTEPPLPEFQESLQRIERSDLSPLVPVPVVPEPPPPGGTP